MEKRKFLFDKLVRDKILDHIISDGAVAKYRILPQEDFIEELKNKVVEESSEVPLAKDNEEFIKELADLQELIDTSLTNLHISKEKFQEIQNIKREKNGGFEKKIFIDYVECTENYKYLNYYLDNPDKYPEIKQS